MEPSMLLTAYEALDIPTKVGLVCGCPQQVVWQHPCVQIKSVCQMNDLCHCLIIVKCVAWGCCAGPAADEPLKEGLGCCCLTMADCVHKDV